MQFVSLDALQRLVQQKAILDRADNFPGGQTTEVTQLRQEMLQVSNSQCVHSTELYHVCIVQ